MSRSKFYGIIYPFFGLNKKPYEIKYKESLILLKRTSKSQYLILDDKELSCKTYVNRIFEMEKEYENERVRFDITARNLEELLQTKVKWGIDSSAKVFELHKKEIFKIKCSTIEKRKEDLLWVKGISYPFEFPKYLSCTTFGNLYVYLVNVDEEWHLYKFSLAPANFQEIQV